MAPRSYALDTSPPPSARRGMWNEGAATPKAPLPSGWPGILVSVLAHVAMFGGALLYAHMAPPRVVPEKPIVAKLVRLGKPRDEKLLPRLPEQAPPSPPAVDAAPAPPPAPEPTPPPTTKSAPSEPAPAVKKLTDKKEPKVEKREEKKDDKAEKREEKRAQKEEARRERALEALERQQRLMEALNRLGKPPPPPGPTARKGEPLPGQRDGDVRGTAEKANDGDRYLALVEEALRRSYVLPATISEKERMHLTCEVFIRIDPDGNVDSSHIQESSGNEQFDRAIEAGLRRMSLPAPPRLFLDRYPDGIAIRYRP